MDKLWKKKLNKSIYKNNISIFSSKLLTYINVFWNYVVDHGIV